MQRALDSALAKANEEARARFRLRQTAKPVVASPAGTDATSPARFLGEDSVVIATPVKREQINARPVIAIEDVVGSRRLGQTAQSLGLRVSYETIGLDGSFDVNRPNLVTICGPRISAAVAGVLASDPVLRFTRAGSGRPWMLHDASTGLTHASGIDQNPPEPYDIAYLGRRRRPDGHGTIMVLTGIHPQGSLGVIELICTQIAELYARLSERCFSVLLRCEYDPETSEPISVGTLTPFYQETTVPD
jgi:hypothetical protein